MFIKIDEAHVVNALFHAEGRCSCATRYKKDAETECRNAGVMFLKYALDKDQNKEY